MRRVACAFALAALAGCELLVTVPGDHFDVSPGAVAACVPFADTFPAGEDYKQSWKVSDENLASMLGIQGAGSSSALRFTFPGPNVSWLDGHKAPLVYREMTGDFALVARFQIQNSSSNAPTGYFNGVGLMAMSTTDTSNWLLWDFAVQQPNAPSSFGAQAWSPSGPVPNTQSAAAPAIVACLVLCRIGNSYRGSWNSSQSSKWIDVRIDPPSPPMGPVRLGFTAHRESAEDLAASFTYAKIACPSDTNCLKALGLLNASNDPNVPCPSQL